MPASAQKRARGQSVRTAESGEVLRAGQLVQLTELGLLSGKSNTQRPST